MLRVQNKLPLGGSNEEPREKRPSRKQRSTEKGGKEREVRHRNRHNMSDVSEKLHKPEVNAPTHEDGPWGHARITNM